jgi:cyclic pyranopterin phosphate synthase
LFILQERLVLSKKTQLKTLTHTTESGATAMVDISDKPVTSRTAIAAGKIRLTRAIVDAIQANAVAKGNVLEVARIAGIQAAKKTSELIPLCHPIPISNIEIQFDLNGEILRIEAEVKAEAKTGVEMEALTAVSIVALTVYDMCKGIDKGMEITSVELIEKHGGKSGSYRKISS